MDDEQTAHFWPILVVVGLAILAIGAFLEWNAWGECRAAGFSVLYCLR